MVANPSREPIRGFAATFGDSSIQPTLPMLAVQPTLANSFALVEGSHQPSPRPVSVYERHLLVFDNHPVPLNPAQIRLQNFDYQQEIKSVRENLQSFNSTIESREPDSMAVGNGYQIVLAIYQVITSPFYRNMSELPLEHMPRLLNIFARTKVQLATLLLGNLSNEALTVLSREIPDLKDSLRRLTGDQTLLMLASTDVSISHQLQAISTRLRLNVSARRTQMMPVASREPRS